MSAYKKPVDHNTLQRITVAIDFSEYTRLLVSTAESLALQSGASLQLVYVAEPWDQHGLARLLAHDERVVKMVQNADAYTYGRMEQLMVDLGNEINPQINVTTLLRQGNASNVIIAAALENGSDLIITGVQGDMPHLFPKNLSTALGLMSESPIPVMAVPHDASARCGTKALKLLICDDLTPKSGHAIHDAFEFAADLHDSEVFHLHVTQLNPQMLDAAIEQASSKGQGTVDPGLNGKMVFALAEKAIVKKMEERLPQDVSLPRGYHPLLREGSLSTFVEEVLQDQAIDILLCGQHKNIHQDPFYVGGMPFTTMVNHKTPVVVFPYEEREQRWREKAQRAIQDIDMTEATV